MTASGRYASPDPSFGRSTGNAAARGGALIIVAVAIGFLLLWQGGVGGSGTAAEVGDNDTTGGDSSEGDAGAGGDESGTGDEAGEVDGGDGGDGTVNDGTGDPAVDDPDTNPPTSTEPQPALRPNGEVRAAVANGTDTSGLAGARSGVLATEGYVTAAVNAANNTSVSNVYYVADYGNEAEQVAILLGGDASVLRPATPQDLSSLVREDNQAQIEGYHVLVVLGTDQLLG